MVKPDELDSPPRGDDDPLRGQPGQAHVGPDADGLPDHPHMQIEEGDTFVIIISAGRCRGGELRVHGTINRLAKSGAEVTRRSRPCTSQATGTRRRSARSSPSCGRGMSCPSTASSACSRPRRASPRGRRPPDRDRPRRERLDRRARGGIAPRRSARCGDHVRRRPRRGGRPGRRTPRPAAPLQGRRPHRRRRGRIPERPRDFDARGDLARLRRVRLPAARRPGSRPSARSSASPGRPSSAAPPEAHPRVSRPARP